MRYQGVDWRDPANWGCNLEHNHRLTGPLRAGRQDPVLPEELLAEHVSALKEWARIPVAVRTQVCVCSLVRAWVSILPVCVLMLAHRKASRARGQTVL